MKGQTIWLGTQARGAYDRVKKGGVVGLGRKSKTERDTKRGTKGVGKL